MDGAGGVIVAAHEWHLHYNVEKPMSIPLCGWTCRERSLRHEAERSLEGLSGAPWRQRCSTGRGCQRPHTGGGLQPPVACLFKTGRQRRRTRMYRTSTCTAAVRRCESWESIGKGIGAYLGTACLHIQKLSCRQSHHIAMLDSQTGTQQQPRHTHCPSTYGD